MTRHTLDARGLMCPEPIVKVETETDQLPEGTRLHILATDPASPIDFEVWCLHKGHRYLGSKEWDDWLEISIEIGTV
jgi:tRNA 2-thiouridine synthesizing protein A